ncbi:hypothetical protein H6G33_17620 [Calothrix sp. FACHB-1219]|uniref:hypothetical protein n=1 Tax=unclassified Calothrix TaxID=2619626 RepID=UPI0016838366|nr:MULTISPECIES: hypothetical protein [unclassified Calothrix]MBD2202698.1 hypothetical protein [Calothrix sp. FACHB-168]MBD2218851.1 hypothetical protein [Calothrix sp. FACHB-1219]
MQNNNNNRPVKLITRETAAIISQYPEIEFLEAGHTAEWLAERKDQLLELAHEEKIGSSLAKTAGIATVIVGAIFHATSPLAPVGLLLGATGYIWAQIQDTSSTGTFNPFPFIRGGLLNVVGSMGNSEARKEFLDGYDEFEQLKLYLHPAERQEYIMLRECMTTITECLNQLESGKRFYAYRWLKEQYSLHGKFPAFETTQSHVAQVQYVSSKIDHERVIQIESAGQPAMPPATLRNAPLPQAEITEPIQQQLSPVSINRELPLDQRAKAVVNRLIEGGFKIDECLGSQVVVICGTQRGGKGTLAAILATLSKALDSSLDTQYFTAGVDVYPFACNLTSALSFPNRDSDAADKSVADELLLFLRKLDGAEPYTNQNLLLVIDEATRLLSLLEEGDRTWAIQYLLNRFAKCGGTLILVLHASNLSSIAGKATAGLADTFKQSVSFIGCVAQSVKVSGLRKINVASGAYFKANPNNFGEPVAGGELGVMPEWLKTENHPGNGQPDPARSLLGLFPELVQQHKAAPNSVINQLEGYFSLAPHEDIEPQEAVVVDFEQIMLIIKGAVSFPVTFDAIRNSRKWGKEKPSVRYLREALAALVQAEKLVGNEKDGYALTH